MTDCFHCGEEDHLSYDCPNRTRRRRAPAAIWPEAIAEPKPTYIPPPPPPRRESTPPTDGYIQARSELGMTSRSALFAVACPWCKSPAYRQCVNPGTTQDTDPHYARQEAAGISYPSTRLQDLALRQVAEARAAHGPDAWLARTSSGS